MMLKALLRCAGCVQSDVKTPVSSIPSPQDACDDNDRAGLSRPSERPDQGANRTWAPDASGGAAGQAPDRLQGRQADEPGLSCAGGLGGRKSIDTARQAPANAEEAAVVTAEGAAANNHVYSPYADSSRLSSELQEQQQQQQATVSQDGQQEAAPQQPQQQLLQDQQQQQQQGAQQQQQLLTQPADPQQQHQQHHTLQHQPVQAEPDARDAASAAAAADKHSGTAAGRGSHHHSDGATAAVAAAAVAGAAVAGAAAAAGAGAAAGCNGGSGTTSTTASSRRHGSHHSSSQPAAAGAEATAAGAAAAAGAGAAGAAAAGAVRGPEPSRTPRDEDLGCCPPYAAKAVWGLRYTMEDKWAAVPSLVMVPAVLTVSHKKSSSLFSKAAGSCGCMMKPSKTRSAGHSRHSSSSAAAGSSSGGSPSTNHNGESEQARLVQHHGSDETEQQDTVPPGMSPALQQLAQGEYDALHYFGVFDGHGGADAAKHCAQFMHQEVADNIRRALDPDAAASGQGDGSASGDALAELQNDSQNNSAASNTAPAAAAATAAAGSSSSDSQQELAPAAGAATAASPQQPRGTPSLAQLLATNGSWLLPVLSRSFVSLDTHFGKISEGSYVGSTAVVVLLGATRLWVAHCGDSRAVLGRRGTAVVLTSDHKASRGDEVARVQAAGGHVWWDRVMGELAVSRAIGDHCLRPYVIPEPEVQMIDRSRDDELLVMASDGLWDVMNNQEAADMALHSLQAAEAGGHVGVAAAKRAAAALTKAALDRGTRDNVTVLVVDLRQRSASGANNTSSNTASGGAPVAGGVAAAPVTSHHRHSSRSHRSSRSAAAAAAAPTTSSSSSNKAAGEQPAAAPAVVPAVAPAVAPAAAGARELAADADASQELLQLPAAADTLL